MVADDHSLAPPKWWAGLPHVAPALVIGLQLDPLPRAGISAYRAMRLQSIWRASGLISEVS